MKLYELQNVKKYYDNLLALDIPSLTLDEGNFYIVYGPNASGKTTLLNILSFLEKPTEGKVLSRKKSNLREVTLVMQNPYLFKTTVFKNVSYGLMLRSTSESKIEKMVKPVMKQLGIWELRYRNAVSLSGGEKRKVAIARALVLDTKVLLLDEPASHLDKVHVGLIENVVSSFAQNKGKTIIMTTHDLSQAHRLTTNIIYLLNGKITRSPLWNLFSVNLIESRHVSPVRSFQQQKSGFIMKDDDTTNKTSNGVKKAYVGPKTEIYTATDRIGKVLIAIDPRNIIVSQKAIRSSALNNLRGRIISISEVGGLVDLVVDAGIKLHVFITHKSFYDMHLRMGKEVFLTFKASAVEVF